MSPAVNALGEATSPYLRQHADNPVHWRQWTPDALAEATARDVPILLSIGYAACHWCHVMAHESFEDDEVAAAMNAGFVCIKVDREERPDLDAVYMNATVSDDRPGRLADDVFPDARRPAVLLRHLLPEARVPPAARGGRRDLAHPARGGGTRLGSIAGELRSMASGLPGAGPPVQPALCDYAVAGVLRDEDTDRGGFGGAPKFPPSALLEPAARPRAHR